MNRLAVLILALAGALPIAAPVVAQPVSAMQDDCARVAQRYFREPGARTEMKYNGQRVDGTHAINGSIFLENRLERFACSFDRDGRRMVEFFAEGRQQNAYLPGHRGKHRGHRGHSDDSGLLRVTGVPRNDILNVRRGPSARSAIVGALANGDRVRNLGCKDAGSSRWCRIQMLDDMRSEGWVNARYLSGNTGR